MLRRCSAHLRKTIFKTELLAEQHMKTYHPLKSYQVYPCPAFQKDSEEGHYHIRDKSKRRKNKRRNKRT